MKDTAVNQNYQINNNGSWDDNATMYIVMAPYVVWYSEYIHGIVNLFHIRNFDL